jgi:hypothetical protein
MIVIQWAQASGAGGGRGGAKASSGDGERATVWGVSGVWQNGKFKRTGSLIGTNNRTSARGQGGVPLRG